MAADLPSRFTADLEESLVQSLGPNLEVPAPEIPSDQQSTTSSARQRRWDDPPEDEPAGPPENITTMVFVKVGTMRSYLETEIMQLSFTPGDNHLVAMAPKNTNMRTFSPEGAYSMLALDATTGQRLPGATGAAGSSHGIRLNYGFAVKPVTGDTTTLGPVVACPFLVPNPSTFDSNGSLMGRLEVYDIGRRERQAKQDVPIRAPIAWSPDGVLLAGVSMLDPSRVMVIQAPRVREPYAKVTMVSMNHQAEVTQLAFLPMREEGGRAMVSAGKDGYVRVTNVATGRTLKKIEIGARHPASIMRVSGDGRLVITVWGRDVVLWYLDTGRVHNYNLDAVRVNEGWPLAVSPDCRYLACRNEEGFDVMDVQTGKFRGEFAWTGAPITAAAFNSKGTRLAIGVYSGALHLYDIVTG
ncbi:quinon protein alcohol dehydrogenase-like superfamily [Corynascus similis CBS 632.67]